LIETEKKIQASNLETEKKIQASNLETAMKIQTSTAEFSKKLEEVKNSLPQAKVTRKFSILQDNITYSEVVITNNFKLPLSSKKTYAVIIQVFFIYEGPGSTHGYLTGNFVQAGNENNNDYIVPFSHYHFNWYYNTETVEYIVPWDPSKGDYLQMQVKSSHCTSAQNKYRVSFVGEFTN